MADEPQMPESEQTPAGEAAVPAEQRAVPTEDATEIAGSAEDAALEAFEEAHAVSAEEPLAAAEAAAEEVEPAAMEVEPAAKEVEPDARETESAEEKPEPVAQAPAPVAQGAPDEAEIAPAAALPEAAAAQPAATEGTAQEPAAGTPGVAEAVAQESPQPLAAASAEAEAGAEVADAGEPSAEEEDFEEEEEEPAPRVKPAVPGAHLEVDIVPEGVDPLGRDVAVDPYAIDEDATQGEGEAEEEDQALPEPISTAAIDLAAGARYRATGKRKTAIARVILRPGSGSYTINGRTLDAYFPRATLQRNIRQPLETVGYEERMDVVARLHGGGVSAQGGALRHGISRALLEADPNLRGELKRRGFLTRDSRAKERKKAGLKKARKRPQFSKR
jgi:small subunit ribosomal protein S9